MKVSKEENFTMLAIEKKNLSEEEKRQKASVCYERYRNMSEEEKTKNVNMQANDIGIFLKKKKQKPLENKMLLYNTKDDGRLNI